MKHSHDLRTLDWRLAGWMPHLWEFQPVASLDNAPDAEVICAAEVPGSVQHALRVAGLLPDWNVGLSARQCEWVENRQWMYETRIPADWLTPGAACRLVCQGLDYSGSVYLNAAHVGSFRGTHIPHTFDLAPHVAPAVAGAPTTAGASDGDNILRVVFDPPPRWLGQFGYTSQMTEWKTRFNYTWDWIPRLVQIGIWDAITLEVSDGQEIAEFRAVGDADLANGTGVLHIRGHVGAGSPQPERLRPRPVSSHEPGRGDLAPTDVVRVTLTNGVSLIREEKVNADAFNADGLLWRDLPIDVWWPNGEGDQPLYTVTCTLFAPDGIEQHAVAHDAVERRVGFRHIDWQPCEGAPDGADPWICVINGRPIFLQGVNFPPVLPNFADTTEAGYRKRISLYRDLGMNVFRINACGFLEKETFYDLCDEMGLLVWQEFPLTSSGVDNVPPSDETSIAAMGDIARSFIVRRQHHASLLLWSGGNELIDAKMHPFDLSHPMLGHLAAVVAAEDPTRRFIATSPGGPRFGADESEFGQGLHWDVHGPWKVAGDWESFEAYYARDDALFRSEVGAPGAAPAGLIRQYAGGCDPLPISASNPLWHNPIGWWVEDKVFAAEFGRVPETLEEYVTWSQARQAKALTIAVGACEARFPACGGAILWCGHDCFPCPTNTSIVDFHGEPKPAALALAEIYQAAPGG